MREQAKQIAASDPEHSKRLFSFANQIAGMAAKSTDSYRWSSS
ncbi:transporter [Cutibacterium acnes JCM 18920]|nr:transporter [Cutibacterium acnes JCM 18920]